MVPEPEPSPALNSPTPDELRNALKAFKKRLKLSRLDDENLPALSAESGLEVLDTKTSQTVPMLDHDSPYLRIGQDAQKTRPLTIEPGSDFLDNLDLR